MHIKLIDGHDCIGGNKILVGSSSGEGFLLDFGVNFKKWSLYFEEYLKPRTGRILHDLLKLELIPKLNIYRSDLMPPQFENDVNVRFVFLSHAHTDHCGLIGLLSEQIPLIMTNETFALLSVMDQLKPSVWEQLAIKTRVPANEEHVRSDVLVNDRKKEKKKRRICAGDTLESTDGDFETVSFEQCWPGFVKVLPVYHSVLGAAALCVEVDDALVVYTGDLRMSPTKDEEDFWRFELGEKRLDLSKRTERFVQEVKRHRDSLKKILILIVEGTRLGRVEESVSNERTVFENARELISKTNRLIIADFPTKHLERLMTFLKIAQVCDRFLVLTPKDYALLENMGRIDPTWQLTEQELSHIRIYHVAKVEFSKLEKDAILFGKTAGLLVSPGEINQRPERFIIAAGYFDMPQILDIDESVLSGSMYIHSTSEAYTEEQQMDYKRFRNWLSRFNIQPFGLRFDNDEVVFTKEFHASGHLSAHDLEWLIKTLEPDFIIPVHTEDKSWFVNKWGSRVLTQEEVYL
ncbi:MBL fold metallo-hydrolase [Thermotoga caldifontis]|uniref:MBL fold metallo-hydrolase n=1 Tax=Thermotoga caldifontis TaxID=1508419 RepID=UPI00059725BC|nr:MBL fold metallo-hydrolase [Thermotoga caldifontis]